MQVAGMVRSLFNPDNQATRDDAEAALRVIEEQARQTALQSGVAESLDRELDRRYAPSLRGNATREVVLFQAHLTTLIAEMQARFAPLLDDTQVQELFTRFQAVVQAVQQPNARFNDATRNLLKQLAESIKKIPRSKDSAESKRELAQMQRTLNTMEKDLIELGTRYSTKLQRWIEGLNEANERKSMDRMMDVRNDMVTELNQNRTVSHLPSVLRRQDDGRIPAREHTWEVLVLQHQVIQWMFAMFQHVPARAQDITTTSFVFPNERSEFAERYTFYYNATAPLIQSMMEEKDYKLRAETIRNWFEEVGVSKRFQDADDYRRNNQEYKRLRNNRERGRLAFERLAFWCQMIRKQYQELVPMYDRIEPDDHEFMETLLVGLQRSLRPRNPANPLEQREPDPEFFLNLRTYIGTWLRRAYIFPGDPADGDDNDDRIHVDDLDENRRGVIGSLRDFALGNPRDGLIEDLKRVYIAAEMPDAGDQFAVFLKNYIHPRFVKSVAFYYLAHAQLMRLLVESFAPSFETVYQFKSKMAAASTSASFVTKNMKDFVKKNHDRVTDELKKVYDEMGKARVWFLVCSLYSTVNATNRVLAWLPTAEQFKRAISLETMRASYARSPQRQRVTTAAEDVLMRQIADYDRRIYDVIEEIKAAQDDDDVKEDTRKVHRLRDLQRERAERCTQLGGNPALVFLETEAYQEVVQSVLRFLGSEYQHLSSLPWEAILNGTLHDTDTFAQQMQLKTRVSTLLTDSMLEKMGRDGLVGVANEYKRLREYILGIYKRDHRQERRKFDTIPLETYQAMVWEWYNKEAKENNGELGRALANVLDGARDALDGGGGGGGGGPRNPLQVNPHGTETYRAFFLFAALVAGEAALDIYDVLVVNHVAHGAKPLDDAQRKLAYFSEINKALVTLRRSNKDSADVVQLLQELSEKQKESEDMQKELLAQADTEARGMDTDLTNDGLIQKLVTIYTPAMLAALTTSLGYVTRTEACTPLGDRSLYALVVRSPDTRRMFASLCATELQLAQLQAGKTKLGDKVLTLLTSKMRQLQHVFKSQTQYYNGGLQFRVY